MGGALREHAVLAEGVGRAQCCDLLTSRILFAPSSRCMPCPAGSALLHVLNRPQASSPWWCAPRQRLGRKAAARGGPCRAPQQVLPGSHVVRHAGLVVASVTGVV